MAGPTGHLLFAENGVLRGFGYAELHDPLGLDLDGFTGCWIATHAGFAIDQSLGVVPNRVYLNFTDVDGGAPCQSRLFRRPVTRAARTFSFQRFSFQN
jgi:hypothetical protein